MKLQLDCSEGIFFKQKNTRNLKSQHACSVVSDSLRPSGLQPTRLNFPWDYPSKNTEVGCHFFLQEIFQTQRLNPHHLHCRQILYNCATRDTICIKTYTYTHITKTKPPNKSVAFRSVAQPCPTHYDPMVCSVPGFTVHHQILELAQTNGQQVCDVIQPSHPLSSPYPPVFNLSQHQGLSQ